ncbi:hypothetical protein DAPPUDRAFT_276297 [Daphnia pulex]|uniref:Uncharacterized protein n=1 Tax=Daphnia pulex TaxID=6669 RepID=E9I5S3_DAPPU|nr:hypothetical protein DAPPUDRAFT_276297 [Daphnia pulex]|eukprot:EFX60657.1 hypothetical protein DAPPUDRAFT_276297 [Daphnia pulex]
MRCLKINVAAKDPKVVKKEIMTAKGSEPMPSKRMVPKTSAIDHSATLSLLGFNWRGKLRRMG